MKHAMGFMHNPSESRDFQCFKLLKALSNSQTFEGPDRGTAPVAATWCRGATGDREAGS